MKEEDRRYTLRPDLYTTIGCVGSGVSRVAFRYTLMQP